MRRAIRAAHIPPAIWDTLTWLRQWEFDEPAMIDELCQDSARPDCGQESSDLSPQP